MIDRISRTRPPAPAGANPPRRDPRRQDDAADAAPVPAAPVETASIRPRINPHAEAKFRLRAEMRQTKAQPAGLPAVAEKRPRRDPHIQRRDRLRADASRDIESPSISKDMLEQQRLAQDNVRQVENPSSHILAISIGDETWSGGEREILGGARRMADGLTASAVVLVRIGIERPDCDAGLSGADRLVQMGAPGLLPEEATAMVVSAIARFEARHVIFADGVRSGDVARRVAAELAERPAVAIQKIEADQVTSRGDGGRSDFIRPVARILIAGAGLFDPIDDVSPREARVVEVPVPSTAGRVRDLGPDPLSVSDVPLSEADFIVSAGDGITDWPAFFDTAQALSGVVGGSRQVCDAGLLPRHRQVGASGTLVEAKAYLALGISGAPQHLQGIQRCRYVLAVNTDLHAAMVKRADIAIIADAQAVMPALAALAREKRHAP